MRIVKVLAGCALAVGLIVGLTANVPTFAAAQGGQLIISKLLVANRSHLKANVPYEASMNIRTPGPPVSLEKLCFFWNTEGPICFSNFAMKNGADGGVHPTVQLHTGTPGTYKLTAFVVFAFQGATYESNKTSTNIAVH